MRTARVLAAALAAACLVCTGCDQGKKGRVIGATVMDISNPFFVACEDSIEAVVEAKGDNLQMINGDSDSSRQLEGIETLIQRKVAAILLNPVDSDAANSGVRKANEAGIPVVTFDVDATGGERACFVESNNILAGELCADYIGVRLKGKGRVLVIDHPGVTSVTQRVEGFVGRMKDAYPEIEIIQPYLVGQGKKEPSMKVTENILGGEVKFDAIFGINDPTALGAAKALKDRGVTDVFVVGIDGAPDAVEELKAGGPLVMSVAQFPQAIGRTAAEMAYKVIAGETVPKHVRVPVMPVTKDNLDAYNGWTGEMPAEFAIPWETDIVIKQQAE